jgi:hypothetical protein
VLKGELANMAMLMLQQVPSHDVGVAVAVD